MRKNEQGIQGGKLRRSRYPSNMIVQTRGYRVDNTHVGIGVACRAQEQHWQRQTFRKANAYFSCLCTYNRLPSECCAAVICAIWLYFRSAE